MKELNKTSRLTMAVAAIVGIFIFGLLTLHRPDAVYKISPEQMLAIISKPGYMLGIDQIQELVRQNDTKIVFVDVRNAVAYEGGHLPNALNIPFRDLLEGKNMERLRELSRVQTLVIYGETTQQANGAWMLLQQTGFQELKMSGATYQEVNSHKPDLAKSEAPLINTDVLKLIVPAAPVSVSGGVPLVKKTIIPKKVETSTGGGC